MFALLCTVAQGVWADTINLSQVTADVTANDGDVLTGTTSEYKVTIAGGATVTIMTCRAARWHSLPRICIS